MEKTKTKTEKNSQLHFHLTSRPSVQLNETNETFRCMMAILLS